MTNPQHDASERYRAFTRSRGKDGSNMYGDEETAPTIVAEYRVTRDSDALGLDKGTRVYLTAEGHLYIPDSNPDKAILIVGVTLPHADLTKRA